MIASLLEQKTLPHSEESERAVLAAILLDPSRHLPTTSGRLRPEDFYLERHQRLYEAMLALQDEKVEIDIRTLQARLEQQKLLQEVGGLAYIATLEVDLPDLGRVEHYVEIVKERSLRRRLIAMCAETYRNCQDGGLEAKQALDRAEQAILELGEQAIPRGFRALSEAIKETVFDLEERPEQILTGIRSGFDDWDALTHGLNPGNLIIIAGRPGMGKCLSAEAEIVEADGGVQTIAEIVRRRSSRLLTLGADHKLAWTSPSAFVDDGMKPVFEVTTHLGRRVKVTASHPFLTDTGWRPLAEIAVGDAVAVPRRIDAFGTEEMGEHRARLLGYLLGDGGCTGSTARFTNGNRALRDDFADAVAQFGGVRVTSVDSAGARTPTLVVVAHETVTRAPRAAFADSIERALAASGRPARRLAEAVGVSPATVTGWSHRGYAPSLDATSALAAALPGTEVPPSARHNVPNRVTRWLADLGLLGRGARDKFVPEAVFRAPAAEIAVFLNRLFATDGWLCTLASGQLQAGYRTTSERLARQVQHLLLRFGVIASLRPKGVRYQGGARSAWQLDITHRPSLRALAERIGIFGKELRAIANVLGNERLVAVADSDVYWDRITEIRYVGEEQVYDLTIPDTHNFVANDVCVHNTSFAINVAQSVAMRDGKQVGIFSLEMSVNELAMRILASESEVPLRKRRPSDRDWEKIHRAARRTAEAGIYIDDSASPTLLEVASKARRLKLEKGLSLVILDYLQLMQAGGRYENRNLEIGAITRGLKGLAKELGIPVIALSQLSRQPERRGSDHRPQLADLRECVVGDTLVLLADGGRVPIRSLVGKTPRVLAIADGRVVEAETDLVWKVGERPVFDVLLASGRKVRATAEHRLLGGSGWVRVQQLSPGDRVAIARRLPGPAEPISWHDDRVALLGHLVGDGSYLTHQPLRYTTASEENSEIVARAATEQFGVKVNRHPGRGKWHQLVLSGNGNRWHHRGVNLWLRELGIYGQRSFQKRLPEEVFRFDDRQVALLLRHLWATDGTIFTRGANGRGGNHVSFSTNSHGLASDVAALLLRLGIVARTNRVLQGKYRPLFNVHVSGGADQKRFLAVVGAFGPKRAAAAALERRLADMQHNTNVDTLPPEAFQRVRQLMAAQGITQRAMAAMRGTTYGGSAHFRFAPSRTLVAHYAELLLDAELESAATSDLFWDRVAAVEPAGVEEVFDLTVPGPSCWLADGIASHNSGSIEQDADLVAFIYRDEIYNPENEESHGLAELIVAKNRNGQTGTVDLAFFGETTTFRSLARHST